MAVLVSLVAWLAGSVGDRAAAAAAVVPGETRLTFQSDAGDYIGGGQTRTWTTVDGSFSATQSTSFVSIAFAGASNDWRLDFRARDGRALTAGPYELATRYPFNSPTRPGISISGSGRGCNTATGRFDVQEVTYKLDGSVDRFAADFEQHCEGRTPALRGT